MQNFAVVCFAIITCFKSCNGFEQNKNIVVTNNGYCTNIAKQLIEIGGNAREVFIAVSLCEGLVHPMDSGLGGGFQAVYYDHDSSNTNAVFIDSREKSPNNFHSDYPPKQGNCIGIPGVLAGYEKLYNIDHHKNRLKWSQIIQPVINLCNTGFYMSKATKEMFTILLENYNNSKIELNTYHMKNPKLCNTFTQIRNDGPSSSMYKFNGYLHRMLLHDLRGSKSLITSRDVRNYRTNLNSPASIKFGNYTVYSSKVPGSGQAVLFALKLMEKMKTIISPEATAPEKLVYLLKILKYTYALQPHLRELSEATINKIINKSSSLLAEGIVKGGVKLSRNIPTKFGDVKLARIESPLHFGTTNVVIKVGNSSITASSSINFLFGSGIVSENLGFFYNNHLKDFSNPKWRRKNKPLENVAGPNKTPSSSISPIIMVDATGKPVFQIGSAGGSKILSAIINTLFNYFVLNKTLFYSVNACRILPKLNHAKNRVNYLYECIEDERVATYLRNKKIDFKLNVNAGHSAVTALSKVRTIPEAVFDGRRGGGSYISR